MRRELSCNICRNTLDLLKMRCTTVAFRVHIKRSYLHANMWMTATMPTRPKKDKMEMYGWTQNEAGDLSATILKARMLTQPAILQDPSTYGKCAFDNRCICRIKKKLMHVLQMQ